MVWFPKGKDETNANGNEVNITVEEFSSITFELRSASSSQILSSTGPLIARFSTTMDDLCCQRAKRGLEFTMLRESFESDTQVADQVESRELYLSWMLRGRLPQAANGSRRKQRYPPYWFNDVRDLAPSKAIKRCLIGMKPDATWSFISCMDWIPVASERGAHLRDPDNIPYILSRVFELNKVYQEADGVTLINRDLGIPNIHIYTNVVKPVLQPIYKVEFETSYSKLTFVEKLDEADIWIVEINGQYYGRLVHELEFHDASEPLLRVAFAQILPLFRLLLQLQGTLEIYVGPHNLTELGSLENAPGLKVPGNIWYSFSREGCFICDEAARDTVEPKDFGELVPHEQKILPLGRDAVDILSHHFSSLVRFLRKGAPDRNSPNLESNEISGHSSLSV
ncbi:hypothetical protein M413DRAFT_27222 [Hebeloma cylindrosporum]|uniref:Uncharacterized protein n=1 Tax=Hebeloma cylindrosporum TaxID=76867 RepID=A0A0C3CFS3_HEBCY|nr:hypothetical protein M413DRAFT_27222 [Hebeloma cylindrosporum h7]